MSNQTQSLPERRLHYFNLLTREEQTVAILRMVNNGMTETTVAAATRLAVEQVRRIVSEARSVQS